VSKFGARAEGGKEGGREGEREERDMGGEDEGGNLTEKRFMLM